MQEVYHMAMESTGVFWEPIYNRLEGLEINLLVVNARHLKDGVRAQDRGQGCGMDG